MTGIPVTYSIHQMLLFGTVWHSHLRQQNPHKWRFNKKVLKMVRPLQRTLAFSLVHWEYNLSSIWYISDTFCIITAAAINSENHQTHTHACVSLLLMLSTTSIQWTSNMQSILQWHCTSLQTFPTLLWSQHRAKRSNMNKSITFNQLKQIKV